MGFYELGHSPQNSSPSRGLIEGHVVVPEIITPCGSKARPSDGNTMPYCAPHKHCIVQSEQKTNGTHKASS